MTMAQAKASVRLACLWLLAIMRASAPEVGPAGDVRFRTYHAVDSTAGYLVSPEFTVRVGHTALKSWATPATDHQLALSLVWAKRWW